MRITGVPAHERLGGRAKPLSRDERRAALINATLPLLRLYGTQVTTRQIAEAAGVAEGTIFRVFADKDELIHAAIDKAFDPSELEDFAATLRASDPLAQRVEAVAEFLLQQNRSTVELMRALHLALKDKSASTSRLARPGHGRGGPAPPMRAEYFRRSIDAITTVLTLSPEPWSIDPHEAAEMLVAMAIAAGVSLPWLTRSGEISARTIATVLLHGALGAPPENLDSHPVSTMENN